MDIFEALRNDHDELKFLLKRLVETSEKNEDTELLLDQIKDELIPHARAEEAVFYNPLREVKQAEGEISHAYGEHAKAEAILQTLRGMEKIGIEWTAAAKKLQEGILHHIEEEEGEIFAIAQPLLSREEAIQMGRAFLEMKEEVENQSDLKNSMDLIANLMPERFSNAVRRFTHPIS